MRLLVTGSAGFIGSHLVAQLLAKGHSVMGIDNLSLEQPSPSEENRYQFRQIDIRSENDVASAFDEFKPEEVVHLAAIHHIPTCEANPQAALQVNVVGTQILLDLARRTGCRRFVLASSGAVYEWGDGALTPSKSRVHPRDVYSVSKMTNEHQCAIWQSQTRGIVVIARLFNVIGPNDRNAHLIPDILRQLLHGDGVRVVRLGNTSPRRDYVYVEDAATALSVMTETDLPQGVHTFNVGTGREYAVTEVVNRLAFILGVSCSIEVDPTRKRAIDRPSQLADVEDTLLRLGWTAKYDLDQALRFTAVGA